MQIQDYHYHQEDQGKVKGHAQEQEGLFQEIKGIHSPIKMQMDLELVLHLDLDVDLHLAFPQIRIHTLHYFMPPIPNQHPKPHPW